MTRAAGIRSVVLGALAAACTAPAPAPARPIENVAPGAPRPVVIPREDIARHVVPSTLDAVRELLAGRWDGRSYDYDAGQGFSGVAGDSPRHVLVFGRDGTYRWHLACEHGGNYLVTRERDDVVVYRDRRYTCHGPDHDTYPSYVHRLDDELLVLIDGMSGGVSAYRRIR
jgi:hypothetical protein